MLLLLLLLLFCFVLFCFVLFETGRLRLKQNIDIWTVLFSVFFDQDMRCSLIALLDDIILLGFIPIGQFKARIPL